MRTREPVGIQDPPIRPPHFLSLRFSPWGLLTAAGTVACGATLSGFLGRLAWFLDLFAHFRVQYFLGLLVLASAALLARRWKTAGVYGAFALVNLVVIVPLYRGSPPARPAGALLLRAMLINVNTHRGDPERVRRAVQAADPDILVLEEISSRWLQELLWLRASHPHRRVRAREDNFGIGLYSRLPLTETKVVTLSGAGVPSILATVETGSGPLRVVATHPVPPGGAAYSRWRNEQLQRLPELIDPALPMVLLGDLNVTPWSHHFQRLLKQTGLRDSARGRGFQPTWPSDNPLLRIPIDHCLHSSDLVVIEREIGEDLGSDHFPVVVDLGVNGR